MLFNRLNFWGLNFIHIISIYLQRKRKTSGTKLPVINIPTRLSTATPDPQMDMPNMWLTKERTEMVDYRPRKQKTEMSFRRAYLQLDELKTGDVFVSIKCFDTTVFNQGSQF